MTTRKYILISISFFVLVAGLTFAGTGFAQVYYGSYGNQNGNQNMYGGYGTPNYNNQNGYNSYNNSYGTPSCSTNTSVVNVNQTATFTANGGNGSYSWSGDNLSTPISTGTQISMYYQTPGVYNIRVMSNGQTGTCTLTVVGNAPSYTPPPATYNPVYYPGLPNTGGGYGRW
jgi:hypothetical protein